MKKILISGGSVAGLTTANLLARRGFDVTLVERSTSVRHGGVAVDVRGEALDVARALGIHDRLVAGRVGYADRFTFVDAAGSPLAALEPNIDVYASPADIEISRDLLVTILTEILHPGVEVIFESWIEQMDVTPDHVEVTLWGRGRREFDIVVGADGLHSGVRRLVFGPERDFVHHSGLYVGVLRHFRRSLDLRADGTTVYNEPGRMVMVRGEARDLSVILGYRSSVVEFDHRDTAQHRSMLLAAFADVSGWCVSEIADELGSTDDLYFDAVGQVKMPVWSADRVALVGDAGYCASFFSGMGTSLAMVGAARLADALSAEESEDAAFAVYNEAMRPIVDSAHALAGQGRSLLFPRTAEELADRNARYPIASQAHR